MKLTDTSQYLSLCSRPTGNSYFLREWLMMKRNSFLYIFKTCQITFMSMIALTVFLRTEMTVGTIEGGGKYFGALFFSLIQVMFNGVAELSITVVGLPVFYKKKDLLFFPACAYALPIWILRIPLSLMESGLWIILTYYTIGFAPAASRFFGQFLAFFGIHMMALSLFCFIAALGRTTVIANTLGTFTLRLVVVLGGYIVVKVADDLQPWMSWAYYVSPMMYGQNAIAMNEFLDDRWKKDDNEKKTKGMTTSDYLFRWCRTKKRIYVPGLNNETCRICLELCMMLLFSLERVMHLLFSLSWQLRGLFSTLKELRECTQHCPTHLHRCPSK